MAEDFKLIPIEDEFELIPVQDEEIQQVSDIEQPIVNTPSPAIGPGPTNEEMVQDLTESLESGVEGRFDAGKAIVSGLFAEPAAGIFGVAFLGRDQTSISVTNFAFS